MDSGAKSNMLNLEENITNVKDTKTRVTVGDSRTLTGQKCVKWHDHQRSDIKFHCVSLSNMTVIPGLYTNLFRMKPAL